MTQTLWLVDEVPQTKAAPRGHVRAAPEANGRLHATMTTVADHLRHLDDFQVVIASAAVGPLTRQQEQALGAFVRRGGGLFVTGAAAAAWGENAALQAMLGLPGTDPTPTTELIVRASEDHDITRRLDSTFSVTADCRLADAAPPDAQVLLSVNWRFASLPLAYLRPCGAGWVLYMGLNLDENALSHPLVHQFTYRAIRYLAGWREGPPVGVAMIGYGAIGAEHGLAIQETAGLDYRLVCDRSLARLDAARQMFPGLRTCTELAEVARDPSIGAVIVGTPPNTHAQVAQQMLQAGKHVVLEKPFCLTTAEADSLIQLAQEQHLALTVYQNRRWDPDFLAIQQVIRAGTLGDIFHVEAFVGGYSHPCNFWHSHEPISGGVFYDWGSHYLDWVLLLLPDEVQDVRASSHKRVWQDVTNADQATLWLRFAGGQDVSFIHSDIAALLKPKWYILGTRGAIVANWRQESRLTRTASVAWQEEPLAPSDLPAEVTVAVPAGNGQIHRQQLALPPAPRHPFHRNLANHLLADEPLEVSPAFARRTIAVMEAASYSAAHNAALVSLAEP